MKSRFVTANITQLTRLRVVNAFLVREDDGLTLVDTTMSGGADALIGAARELGAPIRRIALTHNHNDHLGSVDAMMEQLGEEVELLVPALDAPTSGLTTTPDVLLRGGERIGSLEALPTPGHTTGHTAFVDTRDGAVIGGDVFTAIPRLAVTSHRNLLFPIPAMATTDRVQDLESARALRALGPPVLAVGHGGPLRAPAAAMDRAIGRAQRAAG